MCKLNELTNKQVDQIINEMLFQEVFAGLSTGAFQTLVKFLKFLFSCRVWHVQDVKKVDQHE